MLHISVFMAFASVSLMVINLKRLFCLAFCAVSIKKKFNLLKWFEFNCCVAIHIIHTHLVLFFSSGHCIVKAISIFYSVPKGEVDNFLAA